MNLIEQVYRGFILYKNKIYMFNSHKTIHISTNDVELKFSIYEDYGDFYKFLSRYGVFK